LCFSGEIALSLISVLSNLVAFFIFCEIALILCFFYEIELSFTSSGVNFDCLSLLVVKLGCLSLLLVELGCLSLLLVELPLVVAV